MNSKHHRNFDKSARNVFAPTKHTEAFTLRPVNSKSCHHRPFRMHLKASPDARRNYPKAGNWVGVPQPAKSLRLCSHLHPRKHSRGPKHFPRFAVCFSCRLHRKKGWRLIFEECSILYPAKVLCFPRPGADSRHPDLVTWWVCRKGESWWEEGRRVF